MILNHYLIKPFRKNTCLNFLYSFIVAILILWWNTDIFFDFFSYGIRNLYISIFSLIIIYDFLASQMFSKYLANATSPLFASNSFCIWLLFNPFLYSLSLIFILNHSGFLSLDPESDVMDFFLFIYDGLKSNWRAFFDDCFQTSILLSIDLALS